MRGAGGLGGALVTALVLAGGVVLAQTSPPPPPQPWVFPPVGAPPLPAPPLAINPTAPASASTALWPSQLEIPGWPKVALPPAAVPTAPYGSPMRVLVLPQPPDPTDRQVLADLAKQTLTSGRRCGLREMAPGVFVRLDCRLGPPPATARDVFSPRKTRMLASGKLHMNHNRPAPLPAQREVPSDLVDHRTEGLEGPVKDQGSVGDGTAFSLSTAIDNAIFAHHRRDVTSPLNIWSRYGYPELAQAAAANVGKPVALLGVLPYSPRQACEIARDPDEQCGPAYGVRAGSAALDPALQASLARAEASSGYRLLGLDRVSTRPVNADAIAAVLDTGADVLAGIEIDASAWKVSPGNPVIADYPASDGGHVIVLAGYRRLPTGRQFLVHNSWGGTWGDHGFAWISEAMIRAHTEYALEVRVEQPAGGEPVTLTDEACPDDQLVDAGTGKCAPMCEGETRRSNGRC